MKKLRNFTWFVWIIATFLLIVPDPDTFFSRTKLDFISSQIDQKHIVLFAGLAFLFELSRKKFSWWFWGIFLCVYGLGIEIVQEMTWRTFSWHDWTSDVIGVILGIPFALVFKAVFGRTKNESRGDCTEHK